MSVSDGPRYRAAVAVKKYIIFQFFLLFFKKNKIDFWKKNDFLVDFFGHIPCKTIYGRQPKEKLLFFKKTKKIFFFVFWKK